MAIQTVFKRYELKYKLTKKQYEKMSECMKDKMEMDAYKRHKISNIYFDTDDYRVIRFSQEKPKYKEKLRLRIYGEPKNENLAFIELKKKYDGVVYKRRISDSQENAILYLCDGEKINSNSQIHKEVDYFIDSYDNLLMPKVYISYEREAFFSNEDENFRMTFDFNIKMRDKNISLYDDKNDVKVLEDEYVLLEVKTANGLPFWLIQFLNENEIYKTSFSKYGTAFNLYLLPQLINKTKEIYANA